DIISMHSPATASAQRMIREEHFRQMKPRAIYVSTGRGPTTDEAALIKALDEKMIAAAGLDVLEQEPPGGNNPLLKMDNVILTAHVASATSRFDPARRRRVGQELSLVLSGKWPMSCVNPAVLADSGLKRWQPVSMQRGDRTDRRRLPLHRGAGMVRRWPLPAVERHSQRPDHEMGGGDRRGQRVPQAVELRQWQHSRPPGPADHMRNGCSAANPHRI